jgi:ABC-2 type transport system permease protein
VTVRPLLVGLRELKSYFADWGNLAFSLLIPVVLLALMLGAFGSEIEFSGTAYVVVEDAGPAAEAFLTQLRANAGLSVELLSQDEAADRLDRTAILMYLRIPAGFSDAVAAGEPTAVTIVRRGSGGGQEGQIVSAYIQDAVQQIGATGQVQQNARALLEQLGVGAQPEQIENAVAAALATHEQQPPVTVDLRGDEESTDFKAILFPRIAGWMVLFAVSLNAQSFLEERRQGTLERMLTTRLTRNELFAGKFLGNVLRGLTQFVILFAGAAVVLRIFSVTSFIYSLLFGLVVIAAVSAIGLLIATVARTQGQAVWGAVFATMLMAIFGGTFFDTETSGVFDVISRFTPTYWMNTGFDALIIDGESLSAILPSIAILATIVVVGLVVSRLLFRPIAGGSG